MNIQTSVDSARVVHVSVAGEIDMATVDDLKEALHKAVTHPGAVGVLVECRRRFL